MKVLQQSKQLSTLWNLESFYSYANSNSINRYLQVIYSLPEMGTILILNHLIFNDFDFKSHSKSIYDILLAIIKYN